MVNIDYLLLEDDFKTWRDKINGMIGAVRSVEEYPDMTGKAGYVLSNDGSSVEWLPQTAILENFGIKPGSGDATSFADTVVIGNFAIILDSNGTITAKKNIDCQGSITAQEDITAVGQMTAEGGFIGNLTGNATTANTLKTARYIDGISFNGSKNIARFATCSTGASVAAKVINVDNSQTFILEKGSRVQVAFTATNSAALSKVTLNVNGTGAKNFYIPGMSSTLNTSYAAGVTGLFYSGNNVYNIVYNGTAWVLEGIGLDEVKYYIPTNIALNLNNCVYPGIYMVESSSNLTNTPTEWTDGWLKVYGRNPQNNTLLKQVAFRNGATNTNDFHTFVRTGTSSGTWSDWARFLCDKGDNYMSGALEVAKNITGNQNLTISGTSYVGGASTFAGASTFNNNITCKGSVTVTGTVSANKVYNAVFNDYAEYFERGCDTEPGDIIALDTSAPEERYIKATPGLCNVIVGVHSDTYGHIVGGETAPEGEDFEEWNIKKFIPVGLSGRVPTKVICPIGKGEMIVVSKTPGVGRKYEPLLDDSNAIIGFTTEACLEEGIRRVKVCLR